MPNEVTKILQAISEGQPLDSSQLLPLVYDELRRLAQLKMQGEFANNTLQATALVHEAYLRLVGNGADASWQNRGHFYAAAAIAMRRILVESARRRNSLKRGGEMVRIDLDEALPLLHNNADDKYLDLDVALEKLQREDAAVYELVMLRFFGGLTIDEAAESLGISPRTAKMDWAFARAWIQRELENGS